MPLEIGYRNNKIIFPEFHCNCGSVHNHPDIDIYIGSDILKNCHDYIKDRKLGTKAVLVADRTTYAVAGKYVQKLLSENGLQITLCLLEREDELEPDETALGEVLLSMDKDTGFLIGVGSGSITDVTRYVAFCTGRPFAVVGTAPSMDGYTSVVAPLLFNGQKVNKPASYPKVIICDIDIMKNAPYNMFISGVGDVLGKYIAKADWILGNIINGEVYCPVCADIVMQAVEKCTAGIDEIRDRTEKGAKNLIEALILAGMTILVLGNTRPVASVEHNMAHYWEMVKLAAGEKAPSHGTAVGVGTIYSLLFYEMLIKIDPSAINKDEILKRALTRQQREQEMIRSYGRKIGEAIMHDNPEDFLDQAEQGRRIDAVINGFERIREEMRFLPSVTEMATIMKKLGAPVNASEINVDDKLLALTLKCSKDYRSRYNAAKTLSELGILDKCIEDILNKNQLI